jgi:rhamnogalacturonyl hydrolase YesR
MGLFSSAFLHLYSSTGEKKYLIKAETCLNWLSGNPSETSAGLGWGYPFDWQSGVLIPAGTPNGIVTTAAGDAFWCFYRETGDQNYLDSCVKIGEFLTALPCDRLSPDKICFSYTPLYQNHVHNLNLFVAEFLIKVGMETKKKNWINLAEQAVNYTIADQAENGSFDYNGPPEKPLNFVDNYHTGFVLRMLHSIWKLTNRSDVRIAMDRCYEHYRQNFFENDQIPKLLPYRKYRIDIHSCAEAIYCISVLSETYPEHLKLAGRVMDWTLDNLQDTDGYFYYGILKSRLTGRPYTSRIPYIRWAQAWMLKAMASYHSTQISK